LVSCVSDSGLVGPGLLFVLVVDSSLLQTTHWLRSSSEHFLGLGVPCLGWRIVTLLWHSSVVCVWRWASRWRLVGRGGSEIGRLGSVVLRILLASSETVVRSRGEVRRIRFRVHVFSW
jgi:hypothetical protein